MEEIKKMEKLNFKDLDLASNWGEFVHINLLKETLNETAKVIQDLADGITPSDNIEGDMVMQSFNINDDTFSKSRLTYIPCNLKASDNTPVYFISRFIFEGTVSKGSFSSEELPEWQDVKFTGLNKDGCQVNMRCLIQLKHDGETETFNGTFALTPTMFGIDSETPFNITSSSIKVKIVGLV